MLRTDFSDLVEQHQGDMYRYAFALLHNEEDAQDVTQDILIKAWERVQSLQPEGARAWMLKCLHNLCIDRLRQKTFQSTVPEGDEVLLNTFIADRKGYALCSAETASPEALCLKRERQAVLRRAIAQLPEQFQTVVVLHDLQGIGFKDIAETLGQPIGTVKSNEFRARQKLKKMLEPVLDEIMG
jgi:RNA polymerase sigma-70 factor (ECF subfamily)